MWMLCERWCASVVRGCSVLVMSVRPPFSATWCHSCPLQMEFWKELCKPEPSLSTLDTVGLEYHRSVQIAERGFVDMIRLDARSSAAYRGYAQFLIEVRQWGAWDVHAWHADWLFSLFLRSHSISFTGAQGVPKYNIGLWRVRMKWLGYVGLCPWLWLSLWVWVH